MADLSLLGYAHTRRWTSSVWALLLVVALGLAAPAVGRGSDPAGTGGGTGVWAYELEPDRITDKPPVFTEGGDPAEARAQQVATDDSPALVISVPYGSVSDRFGFGEDQEFDFCGVEDVDVARLRAGWYVDWKEQMDPPRPGGLEFVQMVWTEEDGFSPDAATLTAVAQANPGDLWLVGNEPEGVVNGNSTPAQYIPLYHDVYHIIKAADPTAQVAIGGIVQATPVRMLWLQEVWDGYQARYGEGMPVDVWNVHAFILNEDPNYSWGCYMPAGIDDVELAVYHDQYDHDDMDIFEEQIVRFRQWMADHGQRDKPLIVSEYGILMVENDGFFAPRVIDFMLATFDYFMTATDPLIGYPADGNRLVQRWNWFSLNSTRAETTHFDLFDAYNTQITPLGEAFEIYVTPLWTSYVDLAPAKLAGTNLDVPPDGPTVVSLQVMVRNHGNTDVSNARVQFWVGDETNPVGAEQVIAAIPGRALGTVSVDWQPPDCGTYSVGVTVDGGDLIAEHDEGNNQLVQALEYSLPTCTESLLVPAGNAPPVVFPTAGLTLDCSFGPGGTVQVSRHKADYPSPPTGVGTTSGHWEVSSDFDGAFSCDLTFHYDEADLNGATEGDLSGAARWGAADLAWDYLGGAVDTGANTVTVPGVTVFSPWVLLTSTPPVATTDLVGTRSGGDLQLAWPAVTQNILGNSVPPDHYVVYRRADEPYFLPTPADVIGTPATPSFTDPGILGDPAHNFYYVVTAVDAVGAESALSNRLGAFDFELVPAAQAGERAYNLIAANLAVTAVTDADNLAAYAGAGVYMVLRHDAPTQSIEWRLPGLAGPSFSIAAGDAVYLYLDDTAPGVLSLVGDVPPIGAVSYALTAADPGGSCTYNFISVPLHRTDLLDADALAADIGGVYSISRYNAETQDLTWRMPGGPGDNFPVQAGYPYIVCLDETAPPSWP